MENSISKVIIDPRCRINYASYYILGIMQLYGEKNIKFDITPFEQFPYWGGFGFCLN